MCFLPRIPICMANKSTFYDYDRCRSPHRHIQALSHCNQNRDPPVIQVACSVNKLTGSVVLVVGCCSFAHVFHAFVQMTAGFASSLYSGLSTVDNVMFVLCIWALTWTPTSFVNAARLAGSGREGGLSSRWVLLLLSPSSASFCVMLIIRPLSRITNLCHWKATCYFTGLWCFESPSLCLSDFVSINLRCHLVVLLANIHHCLPRLYLTARLMNVTVDCCVHISVWWSCQSNINPTCDLSTPYVIMILLNSLYYCKMKNQGAIFILLIQQHVSSSEVPSAVPLRTTKPVGGSVKWLKSLVQTQASQQLWDGCHSVTNIHGTPSTYCNYSSTHQQVTMPVCLTFLPHV